MSIHFSQLKPRESKIVFKGKTYLLKPFTLVIETWAYYEFQNKENPNGVEVLSERLRDFNDKDAILRCVYKLMYEKEEFKTYEDFLEAVDKLEKQEQKYIFLMECFYALAETIGLSQPIVTNIEEEIELKKFKAAGK